MLVAKGWLATVFEECLRSTHVLSFFTKYQRCCSTSNLTSTFEQVALVEMLLASLKRSLFSSSNMKKLKPNRNNRIWVTVAKHSHVCFFSFFFLFCCVSHTCRHKLLVCCSTERDWKQAQEEGHSKAYLISTYYILSSELSTLLSCDLEDTVGQASFKEWLAVCAVNMNNLSQS